MGKNGYLNNIMEHYSVSQIENFVINSSLFSWNEFNFP